MLNETTANIGCTPYSIHAESLLSCRVDVRRDSSWEETIELLLEHPQLEHSQ
jgi:hypothetical protein